MKSVHEQTHLDLVFLHALQSLPLSEIATVEAQLAACAECRQEFDSLRRMVTSFVAWPTDILRPPGSLWDRLARRIAADTGTRPLPMPGAGPAEPEWKDVAPGIWCKLLATDAKNNRVSMLVRLAPGADYPPHRHAGVEELYLLHGELMVDERKLYPGDYIRAEAGSADRRVWSQTGCTCVLLTSTHDVIL